MPTKDIVALKNTSQADILNAIKYDASLSYQQRIPDATKANIQDVMRNLQSYRPHFNEFIDAMVNRIGLVWARNTSWTNPLAEFKRGMLEFGDTIEEIQVGLLQAHTYDPDKDYSAGTLFGQEIPLVQSNFHKVNRQNFYRVTVNENLLVRAFLSGEGVNDFARMLMEAPMTSDQWDEFLLTCSLFAEYEANGGFYHVNVPDVARMESNADDARMALRKMRAMADNLRFMSTKYNASRMPTRVDPDDLVIFTTPEFNAAVDVNALAAAFNMDRANVRGRIVPIPSENFGIDGCQAIMTSRDFFVIADQLFEMRSQPNAASLATNYFLHRWEVISASRFVPAVMFTTKSGQDQITITHSITDVPAPTIVAMGDGTVPTSVARGGMVALTTAATDAVVPSDAPQANAVVWSLAGQTSTRTYITQTGVVHAGIDEEATALTVTARSAFISPTNTRLDGNTGTLTLNVTGDTSMLTWPEQGLVSTIQIAGYDVAGVASGTTTYSLTLPTGTTVSKSSVKVGTYNSADVTTTVTKVSGGYTVAISVDPGTGPAVAYTVNVTA